MNAALGIDDIDNEDYKGAIQDLNKAIEIDSEYLEAYLSRAHAWTVDDARQRAEPWSTALASSNARRCSLVLRAPARSALSKTGCVVHAARDAVKSPCWKSRARCARVCCVVRSAVHDHAYVSKIHPVPAPWICCRDATREGCKTRDKTTVRTRSLGVAPGA